MKKQIKLSLQSLEKELELVKSLHHILGGNGGGAEIKLDSAGRTYQVDNTGRVHYLIDTQLLFEGIMDSGKSFASWVGAGWDLVKGNFNLPATLGSVGFNAIESVFNEWKDKYFLQDGYVKVGDTSDEGDTDTSREWDDTTDPGDGLPPY